jgi:hypothetical protein
MPDKYSSCVHDLPVSLCPENDVCGFCKFKGSHFGLFQKRDEEPEERVKHAKAGMTKHVKLNAAGDSAVASN